mmetsp:Transcript_5887/g.4198  ORF Transcript_5887/g.4198 Transcript_5887/m.4198 type:complete len:178 (-) Transcript_5887:748-1281(-)
MFNLANFLDDAKIMKHYGVNGIDGLNLDFSALKQARDTYVKRLNQIYMTNVKNSDVDFIQGKAKFIDKNLVQVSAGKSSGSSSPEDRVVTADHILIASGSEPAHGLFEGSELCMDSNDFFEMEELPESVAVIGGGYIGIELAQILHSFGVDVTLIVRSVPLRFVDREVVQALLDNMQ